MAERNRATSSHQILPFDPEMLDRSTQEINNLTSRLPQGAVEALAREVVTRLAGRQWTTTSTPAQFSDEEIDRLALALIDPEQDAAIILVNAVKDAGATIDEIYLAYLAMAARRLGEWWDTDRVSFVQVRSAATRIYAIMRSLQHKLNTPPQNARRHAVFAAVPGEDHMLGITMAADLCEKRGWKIDLLREQDHDKLVAEIVDTQAVIVGLSASNYKVLADAARLILAIRIAVPAAKILISGHSAVDEEDLAELVGADYSANDFESALTILEMMVERSKAKG